MSLRLGSTIIAGSQDLSGKANTDLSNLTSTGKNIGNWSSNITNCITYIPQDINLELDNGTLTLKAGSKVCVPNGFEQDGTTPKFDVITIDSDKTLSSVDTGSTDVCVVYKVNTNTITYSTTEMSGSTAPTTGLWYNTTANLVKFYSGGSDSGNSYSFPIGRISRDSGSITGIVQIFNGFGYIGSTFFALPGTRLLAPDGRNEDGTLKNYSYTIQSIITRTAIGANVSAYLAINCNEGVFGVGLYVYNEEENLLYLANAVSDKRCIIGFIGTDNDGKVSSFKIKTVFHVLDYNNGAKLDEKNTFTRQQILNVGNTETSQEIRNESVSISTIPSSTQTRRIRFTDKDGNRIAEIQASKSTDGTQTCTLVASNSVSGSTVNGTLTVRVDSSGKATSYYARTDCSDGQWVSKSISIASGISGDNTYSNTFTISDLPNDGNKYECLIVAGGRSGTTSGNSVQIWIGSNIVPSQLIGYAVTRTSNYVIGGGCAIVPVGSDRKINLYFANANGTMTNVYLQMKAYRRIGTNT